MNKLKFNSFKRRVLNIFEQFNSTSKILKFWRIKKFNKNINDFFRMIDKANKIILDWPQMLDKPFIGLVKDEIDITPYWPIYERFLINNGFSYEFFDIHKSNFEKIAEKYEVIIWRTPSEYSDQWEAKSKIKFIERELGKYTLPSTEELWFYEDKLRQQWLFNKYDLPIINTFISFSKEETEEFIENCNFPVVSKEATSSASQGVCLIKNKKEAHKFCNEVFGPGRKTMVPYIKQKDYVFFQDFIQSDGYDLRVIIIGDDYFGYFRKVPKGDFRASGAGIVIKKAIPKEALILARNVKNSLPSTNCLAVDMLRSIHDNSYRIIEASIFIKIETPIQLSINGIAGKYTYKNGGFKFTPGQFWIQELTLREFFKKWVTMKLDK